MDNSQKTTSTRYRIVIMLAVSMLSLCFIFVYGFLMDAGAYDANFKAKNLSPSLAHLFGTDWLGRDMLSRTIKGLSTSIVIGIVASSISAVMAVVLGTAAATLGKKTDMVITWVIDLFMSVPHLILIMLISIACGKGLMGVLIGVAVTHWTSLARVIRAEVLALKNSQYIGVSRAMGKSNIWIARKHIFPHIFPQFIVGLVLTFPHAILHEASVTFLGFGLSPEQPAIGIILSESMRFLSSGMWWLAVFPGLVLLLVVMLFDAIGETLRILANPTTAHN